MLIFLLLYISVYLLMHGYAFVHARRVIKYGRGTMLCLGLLTAWMIASPILVRILERQGFEAAPRLLAYTGFTWMGLLMLFIVVAAVCDLASLGGRLVMRAAGVEISVSDRFRRKLFYAEVIVVLVMYGYGLYEAGQIRVEHLVLTSPKISAQTGTIRLAQISDVHLGLIVREKRLTRILDRVREAAPDILVSTGDLVDGQMDNMTGVAQLLRAVNSPFGKYAVTGNHEFYAGLEAALAFTRRAGFTVLRNRAVTVRGITLVGVDDLMIGNGGNIGAAEQALLGKLNRDAFILLLKHRPVVNPGSLGRFDLELSGHTHNGQIFPYTFFTRLAFPYPSGLNRLKKGFLYINRGSGTWGPPIRFLEPPEVTIIDLVHEKTPLR